MSLCGYSLHAYWYTQNESLDRLESLQAPSRYLNLGLSAQLGPPGLLLFLTFKLAA